MGGLITPCIYPILYATVFFSSGIVPCTQKLFSVTYRLRLTFESVSSRATLPVEIFLRDVLDKVAGREATGAKKTSLQEADARV